MTRWFTKPLRALLRQEHGVVAVAVAVFLTSLVGITGAAVDMGMFYTGKAELQNAADAAALAAANTMVTYDANDNSVAQAEQAETTASQISQANKALSVNLNMRNEDYTIGYWDFDTGDFDPDRTGPSSDPDDLTAVRVTLRRDDLANTPVTTIFSRIVGLQQVNLSATSVAFLGWAGSVPAGTVDLPIAVHESAVDGEEGGNCGQAIQFYNNNIQNSMWTTFFEDTNACTLRHYLDGSAEIPELKVGDMIKTSNGTIASVFNELEALYNANKDASGEWTVLLPVYADGPNTSTSEVVGFCHMTITEVTGAPDKIVWGRLECGMTIPTSSTGGGNYGSRANYAKLIQ